MQVESKDQVPLPLGSGTQVAVSLTVALPKNMTGRRLIRSKIVRKEEENAGSKRCDESNGRKLVELLTGKKKLVSDGKGCRPLMGGNILHGFETGLTRLIGLGKIPQIYTLPQCIHESEGVVVLAT